MRYVTLSSLAFAGCAALLPQKPTSAPPGVYERGLAHATQVSDASLVAALQKIGPSSQYAASTADMVACLSARAGTVRWQRQTETGDLITRETITADQTSPQLYLRPAAAYDAQFVDHPAAAWAQQAMQCVDLCGIASREQADAQPYLGACQTSLSAAVAAKRMADELGPVNVMLDDLVKQTTARCFIGAAIDLDKLDRQLARIPASDAASAMRAQVATLRSDHAAELAKVAAFNRDPRVVALQAAAQRLAHQINLVHDAQRASSDNLSPESVDRDAVYQDLLHSEQDNDNELAAIARQAGVACGPPT